MNECVLVVDDEPSVQEVARAYLEREGFIVDSAMDGPAALAAIERKRRLVLGGGAQEAPPFTVVRRLGVKVCHAPAAAMIISSRLVHCAVASPRVIVSESERTKNSANRPAVSSPITRGGTAQARAQRPDDREHDRADQVLVEPAGVIRDVGARDVGGRMGGLHAEERGGRRPVVLAVDHVADPADGDPSGSPTAMASRYETLSPRRQRYARMPSTAAMNPP